MMAPVCLTLSTLSETPHTHEVVSLILVGFLWISTTRLHQLLSRELVVIDLLYIFCLDALRALQTHDLDVVLQ